MSKASDWKVSESVDDVDALHGLKFEAEVVKGKAFRLIPLPIPEQKGLLDVKLLEAVQHRTTKARTPRPMAPPPSADGQPVTAASHVSTSAREP